MVLDKLQPALARFFSVNSDVRLRIEIFLSIYVPKVDRIKSVYQPTIFHMGAKK